MTNIDSFNLNAAAVLSHLYDAVPKLLTLDVQTLRTSANLQPNSDQDDDDIGHTIVWLSKEGFVRYSGEIGSDRRFANVVLTKTGLEVLNRVPDSIAPSLTTGARLKSAFASGAR